MQNWHNVSFVNSLARTEFLDQTFPEIKDLQNQLLFHASDSSAIAMESQVDLQQESTIYVRNLEDRVTEKLLEELFVQVGPVNSISIRDPQQQHKTSEITKNSSSRYAFVEFADVESVLFACEVMDATELYGQKIKVQPRDNTHQKAIYYQMNMHIASVERHHPFAVITKSNHSSARHSDTGVYNEIQQQSNDDQGTGGRQRVVTFNQSQGPFVQPKMPLPRAPKTQQLMHSHPKADRQQHSQLFSHSNFGYPSGGPSDIYHHQLQTEPRRDDRFTDRSVRPNIRSLVQFNSMGGQNFGGRRSAPYSKERGHFSKENYHRKSDR